MSAIFPDPQSLQESTTTVEAAEVPSFLRSHASQSDHISLVRELQQAETPATPAPRAQEVTTLEVDEDAEGIRSYLAPGEVIEGNIRLKSGIRIAGEITGRVLCETGTVLVESTGVVGGGITASSRIIVDGVVGNPEHSECTDRSEPAIHTPGLLAVLNNGKVYGCYSYGRIATYDDATVEGLGKKIKA